MPGQAGWRLRLFVRYLFNAIDQLQVLVEVLALEARRGAPEVAFRQVLESLNLPGQKAAPQRTVSNEANTQLAYRRPGSHPPRRGSTGSTPSATRLWSVSRAPALSSRGPPPRCQGNGPSPPRRAPSS